MPRVKKNGNQTFRKVYNIPEDAVKILRDVRDEYGCNETQAIVKVIFKYRLYELRFRGVEYIKICRQDGSEEKINILDL